MGWRCSSVNRVLAYKCLIPNVAHKQNRTGHCSENFDLSENIKIIIRMCFHFNTRCGIWGCFRVSTAADYDLLHALTGE